VGKVVRWLADSSSSTNTINGSYVVIDEITNDEVVIIATGTEVVTGNDSIQVKVIVHRMSINRNSSLRHN